MTYQTSPSTYALFPNMVIEPVFTVTGDNGPKANTQQIVGKMMDVMRPICYCNEIFVYDDRVHHYTRDQGHIDTFVAKTLNLLNLPVNNPSVKFEAKMAAMVTNVASVHPFKPQIDAINCKNGVVLLTLDGLKLVPHSPDYMFDYCIDTNFDMKWHLHTPELDTILCDWGHRDILIDIPAIALVQKLREYSFKTAFMIEGGPDTGKTTWLDLLKFTFGLKNYSETGLSDLSGGNRFALSTLEHKLVNIADEVPVITVKNTDMFKRLTGSCRHQIERKFEGQKQGVLTAPLVFACNELPIVTLAGDVAFWGRWHLIEFGKRFNRDMTKQASILSEPVREQLLMRALLRSLDILRNGWNNPQSADHVIDYWMRRTVDVDLFLSDSVMHADYKDKLLLEEIHHRYENWCKAQEPPRSPMSKYKVSRRLLEMGYRKDIHHAGGVRFTGINWKFA